MYEFSIGSVLSMSVRAIGRNFGAFCLLTTIALVPAFAYAAHRVGVMERLELPSPEGGLGQLLVLGLFGLLWMSVVVATLAPRVVKDAGGDSISADAKLDNGLAPVRSGFFVALATSLAVAGCIVLSTIPGFVFAYTTSFGSLDVWLVMIFMFAIIPAVIVNCTLLLAVPAAVVEQTGVISALGRSRELTKGRRLELFGLLFMVGLVRHILNALIDKLLRYINPKAAGSHFYAECGIGVVFIATTAVIAIVAYSALRNQRDGAAPTELVAM